MENTLGAFEGRIARVDERGHAFVHTPSRSIAIFVPPHLVALLPRAEAGMAVRGVHKMTDRGLRATSIAMLGAPTHSEHAPRGAAARFDNPLCRASGNASCGRPSTAAAPPPQRPDRVQRRNAEGAVEDPLRRFFNKVTLDGAFCFDTAQSAARFGESLESYSNDDLPWRLTRTDQHGVRRLAEAAAVGGVTATIAIVRALVRPQYREPRYTAALQTCVRELSAAPGILAQLAAAVQAELLLDEADLSALAEFGVCVMFAHSMEPGALGELLAELAGEIIKACVESERTPPRAAERLRILAAGARSISAAALVQLDASGTGDSTAHQPLPGGRHLNDRANFRAIQLVPTLCELTTDALPFLPRPTERFLAEDAETQLLDRHFRLLREDMLAPVRAELASDACRGVCFPVVDVQLELHQFTLLERELESVCYGHGPIGVRFTLALPRAELEVISSLQRRRLLQADALVVLRVRGCQKPMAIGRVVEPMRVQSKAPDLNPLAPRQLGVAFDDKVLADLIGSRQRDLEVLSLAGTYGVYGPVLSRLQMMRTLPFSEELLCLAGEGAAGGRAAPEYAGAERILGRVEDNLRDANIEFGGAQRAAFEHMCSARVALVVGPPGTGKSFLASHLARAATQATGQTILTMAYTNHGEARRRRPFCARLVLLPRGTLADLVLRCRAMIALRCTSP